MQLILVLGLLPLFQLSNVLAMPVPSVAGSQFTPAAPGQVNQGGKAANDISAEGNIAGGSLPPPLPGAPNIPSMAGGAYPADAYVAAETTQGGPGDQMPMEDPAAMMQAAGGNVQYQSQSSHSGSGNAAHSGGPSAPTMPASAGAPAMPPMPDGADAYPAEAAQGGPGDQMPMQDPAAMMQAAGGNVQYQSQSSQSGSGNSAHDPTSGSYPSSAEMPSSSGAPEIPPMTGDASPADAYAAEAAQGGPGAQMPMEDPAAMMNAAGPTAQYQSQSSHSDPGKAVTDHSAGGSPAMPTSSGAPEIPPMAGGGGADPYASATPDMPSADEMAAMMNAAGPDAPQPLSANAGASQEYMQAGAAMADMSTQMPDPSTHSSGAGSSAANAHGSTSPSSATQETYTQAAPVSQEAYTQAAPASQEAYTQAAPASQEAYTQAAPASQEAYTQAAPVSQEAYTQAAPASQEAYSQTAPASQEAYSQAQAQSAPSSQTAYTQAQSASQEQTQAPASPSSYVSQSVSGGECSTDQCEGNIWKRCVFGKFVSIKCAQGTACNTANPASGCSIVAHH